SFECVPYFISTPQPPRPGFPLHAPSVHIRTGTCPEPFDPEPPDPEPPDPAPPGPAPPEVASPPPPLMHVLPGPGRRSRARRWRGRTPARPRSRERREGRRRCPLRCSHPRFRGPFRWGSCPRSGGLPDRSFPPRPIRPRSRGTAPPRFSPAGAATHPGRSCSSTPSPRTRAVTGPAWRRSADPRSQRATPAAAPPRTTRGTHCPRRAPATPHPPRRRPRRSPGSSGRGHPREDSSHTLLRPAQRPRPRRAGRRRDTTAAPAQRRPSSRRERRRRKALPEGAGSRSAPSLALRGKHGGDVLRHRVGEDVLRQLARLGEHAIGDRPLHLELEALSLTHRREPGEAHAWQHARDRLSLRVQNLRLRHDLNDHTGHYALLLGRMGERFQPTAPAVT